MGGYRNILRRGEGAKGKGVNWSWLRNILRVKEEDVSGAKPQPLFIVMMLLRRVFVVFVSSGRRKTRPL